MKQRAAVRIGVIADTHGLYDPAVEEHFSGVSGILHAGDIGDPFVIRQLRKIAPVVAVSGNVDEYEKSGFPRRVILHRGRIRIAVCHVLYEKGKLTQDARVWLDREQPDVCVFGHSHRPTIERYAATLLFNPGSAGPRRFSLPRSIGLLTVGHGKVKPRLVRLPDRAEGTKPITTRRTEQTKGES
jgi:putative phosphoesterase